ncbi:MAG: RNA polymerase sigma factor [Planctomycetota bacterium]
MKPRTADAVLDEALVMACQARQASAYMALVDRWQPRLLRYLTGMTGRREIASDLAQDVWLAVMRGLPHLQDPARFPAWLYRIAGRHAADWVGGQQRRRRYDAAHREHIRSADSADSTSNSDEAEALHAALDQLSTEHREAVVMHYLQHMSVADIAQALELPLGTVKSRLHHARLHLRKLIDR